MLQHPDMGGHSDRPGDISSLFQNRSSIESNDIPGDVIRHPMRHNQESKHRFENFENIYNSNNENMMYPSLNYTSTVMPTSTDDYFEGMQNTTFPYIINVTGQESCNNSNDFVNVTCEFPIQYAQPMYGYIAPFLLATTIVANTLIVVVLSRRHMRTPTNAVLMAMALCDMFTFLFPAPWLFYMYTFGNHYKPLTPIEACYAWNIMNEVRFFKFVKNFLKFHYINCYFYLPFFRFLSQTEN